MSWIDLSIVIILAGCLIMGFLRGFIKEVIGIVSVAAGLYVSRMFGSDVSIWITDVWELHPAISEAFAYAVVFVVISTAVSLGARLLSELVQAAHLSTLNRLLGGVAGLVKGCIVVLVAVFAISKLDEFKPFMSEDTKTGSPLYSSTIKLSHDCLSITRSQFGGQGEND